MSLHVHRIVVDAWPTEDGRAWERFYGYDAHPDGIDDVHYDIEPPEWVLAQVDNPTVEHRFTRDTDGTVTSVCMPKPGRRHYLSATAARSHADQMRAFGAQVHVQRSDPVHF